MSDISADVFAEGGGAVIPENQHSLVSRFVVTLSISFSVGYAGAIC